MGCNDIVELASMFDATSRVGLGGVGWGVTTSWNLHACLMLRHTWGWVGRGCNDIVELARMFVFTSHVGLGGVGWGVMTLLNLHACLFFHHVAVAVVVFVVLYYFATDPLVHLACAHMVDAKQYSHPYAAHSRSMDDLIELAPHKRSRAILRHGRCC